SLLCPIHSHISISFSAFYPFAYYSLLSFFFFHDPATTQIYTLSLHDALPISASLRIARSGKRCISEMSTGPVAPSTPMWSGISRSEEHTSELQSHLNLVCRLLLEKKK